MADLKAIQQLDLNLLKIFESLYQERNMTRTAEQLHLTPSAVSHAMKRLRQCLDDPLFERAGNEMRPTPSCQRMAPLIMDNLSRLRQILQQWGEFDPTTSQYHFRIAMHDALEPSILPRLARLLAKRAPNITLASVKIDRTQLSRELAAGHIDVAFDVALPLKNPVLHQFVSEDEFALLCDVNHPLVDGLSRSDYFKAQHIAVSHRPSGAAMEDLIFQEQGLARNISVRCQNYYAAKEMVKGTATLLTLPASLAQRLLDDDLALLTLPFPMQPVKTHLYWHQQTEQDAALSWLRTCLLNAIKGTE